MFAPMTDSAASPAAADAMDRMYRWQRHIYDLTRKYYLLGRDRLIDELEVPTNGSVLEIGCGTGRNLIRIARKYPTARICGIDISNEMLATARRAVARAGLENRIALAQGDATGFDAAALFGVSEFDRVFLSYALSMIPPWRAALLMAMDKVRPGGSLHIVDFSDLRETPVFFRVALRRWLARFEVHPRTELPDSLVQLSSTGGWSLEFRQIYRRYASLGRLNRLGKKDARLDEISR